MINLLILEGEKMLFQILIRTCAGYFILLLMLKIMGKREIGQLSLFDLIILLSIADIMIIGIENVYLAELRIYQAVSVTVLPGVHDTRRAANDRRAVIVGAHLIAAPCVGARCADIHFIIYL